MYVEPIGVIRSPFHSKDECPIQPLYAQDAVGTVEVFEAFSGGLKDVELFTHLFLVYAFDRAGAVELVRPTFLDDEPHGVFASRHPCRPSRIGLSVVELVELSGRVLTVRGIDVLDETPLLDIKPYIHRFDAIESANDGWVTGREFGEKPSGRE
jgi:tRNA-Thr(GGU) m(6)t(6)A37 methyltransferase TsaA